MSTKTNKFFAYLDLHTHCTPPTFLMEKNETLLFLIEHEKLYKINP